MKSRIAATFAVTMVINLLYAQPSTKRQVLIPAKPVIEALAEGSGRKLACKESAWDLMPPLKSGSAILSSLTDVLNYCCRSELLNYDPHYPPVVRIVTTKLGDSVLDGHYVLFYLFDQEGNPLTEIELDINGKIKKRCPLLSNGMLLLPGLEEGDIITFPASVNTEKEVFHFSGRPVQLICLRARISELAQVKVNVTPNGYQDIEIDHVTGAHKDVEEEQFTKSVETDLVGRLRYSAPAYLPPLYHIPGGYPYTGTSRGINTVDGDMGLLFILDNMPLRNPEMINPNDIATINIAQDAATMALYGSRAANGVVIMTSKKSFSKTLQAGFISTLTLIPEPFTFQSLGIRSPDYVDIQQRLFNAGAYDKKIANQEPLGPFIAALADHRNRVLSKEGLDSVKEHAQKQDIRRYLNKHLYRPGYVQQSFLYVAQSFKDFRFYSSIGNDRTLHNIQGSYHNRTTGHISATWSRINNLSVFTNLSFTNITGRKNPYRLSTAIPYLELVDVYGNPLPIPVPGQNSLKDTMANGQPLDLQERPVQEWILANDKYKQYRASINSRLTWQLRPWLGLNVLYNHGKTRYSETIIHDKESFVVRNELSQHASLNNGILMFTIPQGDIYNFVTTSLQFNDARFQVNITTRKASNKLVAIAGIETQSTKMSTSSHKFYGYGTAWKEPALQNTGTDSIDFYTGMYLNAIYSIGRKFVFSGNLRKDQMNRYGPQPLLKGWPFYSLGTAVHIHKFDSLFKKWPAITLRATIGESGNDQKTLQVNTTIKDADPNYFNDPVSNIEHYGNTKLGPERIRLINAGIELRTKDNIFQFGFDYFWKKSYNLLGWQRLNPTSGVPYLKSNNTSLKGHGFDFYIKANYEYPHFKLYSSLWLSHTINTITSPQISLDEVYKYSELEYYRPQQFYPVHAFYALRSAGLDSTGDPVGYLDGNRSKEYEKILNNKNPGAIKYIGPALPRYYGSITQSMQVYNFIELSFQISCKLGYYYKRQSFKSGDLIEGTGGHHDFYFRWQQPGDERWTTVPSLSTVNNQLRDRFYEHSEAVVHPADHIRLEFLRAGLLFDSTRLRMLKKSTLSCHITLHNIKPLWTKNRYHEDPAFAQYPYVPGTMVSISTQLNF